jgi:hypothetical protein
MKMPRNMAAIIRAAIDEKVGFTTGPLRAYVIDEAAEREPDYECPADDALPIGMLCKMGRDDGGRKLTPNCRLDVYVYTRNTPTQETELDTNIEVTIDDSWQVSQCLDTREVILRELQTARSRERA